MVQTSEGFKKVFSCKRETSKCDIASVFRELIALMPLVALEEMRRRLEIEESKGEVLQAMIADIGREIIDRSHMDQLKTEL